MGCLRSLSRSLSNEIEWQFERRCFWNTFWKIGIEPCELEATFTWFSKSPRRLGSPHSFVSLVRLIDILFRKCLLLLLPNNRRQMLSWLRPCYASTSKQTFLIMPLMFGKSSSSESKTILRRPFLVACTGLYKSLCPPVRPSVGRSVHHTPWIIRKNTT